MFEDSSDKESEADSINKNPIIFDHLFTPKLKDTESDLTPKKRLNGEIHENETIENKLKLKNINKLVIGHSNINSLPSKFFQLKLIIEKKY